MLFPSGLIHIITISQKETIMKKVLTTLIGCLLLIGAVTAQEFKKLDKSPLDVAYFPDRAAFRNFEKDEAAKKANEPVIRVIYSRPLKNDRKIFGELVKYDEVWRAGANESSEIHFYKDVTIGDQRIKAGRYTFYVKPSASEWEVHFNTDLDGMGGYHFNPDHNVAVIAVPTEKTSAPVEAFSIIFENSDDGAHMIMGWDDTMVRVPIKM